LLHNPELDGAAERLIIADARPPRPMSVTAGEGGAAVLIVDELTGDELAEVFHCDLHAVAQTPEHAVFTARLFAASSKMLAALMGLVAVRPVNHDDDDDIEARDAWRAASAAIAAVGVPA